MPHSLRPRQHWVFDLDNTLYPPQARLFDQIEIRMTAYVMAALGVARAEADHLRRSYWARYGTTLAGLMAEHGVDPEPYLVDVHDISLDHLCHDPDLRAAIAAIEARTGKVLMAHGFRMTLPRWRWLGMLLLPPGDAIPAAPR